VEKESGMYFDKPGRQNTERTLELAAARARELGIGEAVLATSTGETALKALEIMAGIRLVAVTYHCGFKEPFQQVLPTAQRSDLNSRGVTLVTASHALSGLERSVASRHSGVYPVLLMADTLKLFGQGTKVAVEIAVMAADAGALSGGDIISIGGSGRGADTALVLKPAHQNNFFELRIREIICKPRDF
jgi:hypothetical protein